MGSSNLKALRAVATHASTHREYDSSGDSHEFAQLAALSMEHLDNELGTISGHINAANYRLLAVIGELERREPWGAFCCKTGAHYLNWRCGIALGAAREKVRTAVALRNLPKVREAFRVGRLSDSKVRAITRVANCDNETDFLEIAFGGTASHVERVVRHYRQIESVINPQAVLPRREFSGQRSRGNALCRRTTRVR